MSLEPTTYPLFFNACETAVEPENPSKTLSTFNSDIISEIITYNKSLRDDLEF